MDHHDTIVAPATAVGEGGIGIVRLSGPLAETRLLARFRPTGGHAPLHSHRLYHGRFVADDGSLVDEVMAVVMRAPRSYTREDVVEVHCHGGPLVLRRVLDLLSGDGVRLARPGEFTLRAFLNGRIDLTRAEAVIDVIRSRSEAACDVALQQADGRLASAIYAFNADLADLLAEVETHIDFPEEDIEFPVLQRLCDGVGAVRGRIESLLSTFDAGRTLREGVAVLILGRPNAGKSSLMNALLGEARAIVTDVAGTTRDTIEESMVLGTLPLRLVDTAGVRDTVDPIEAEGVRRARQKAASADLILLVVDGSRPIDEEDRLALEVCDDRRVLLVVNKGDLPQTPLPSPFTALPAVSVSAHSGDGLEELRRAIEGFFLAGAAGEERESVVLSDRRHREALLRARAALERFAVAAEGALSPEFLAVELREALDALGEITGETTPDAILERIFSRFCIGK